MKCMDYKSLVLIYQSRRRFHRWWHDHEPLPQDLLADAVTAHLRGDFEDYFAQAPECDRRTNAGKLVWGEFLAGVRGRQILSVKDGDAVARMLDSFHASPIAPSLVDDTSPHTFRWEADGLPYESTVLLGSEHCVSIFSVDPYDPRHGCKSHFSAMMSFLELKLYTTVEAVLCPASCTHAWYNIVLENAHPYRCYVSQLAQETKDKGKEIVAQTQMTLRQYMDMEAAEDPERMLDVSETKIHEV